MLLLLMSRPHLIPGTVYATLEATYFADKNFDESHGLDNLANAYKHALWNILIAFYVQRFFSTPDLAIRWADKVTGMHEVCFQNKQAAMDMDLYNNMIGRKLYLSLYNQISKRPQKKLLLDQLWREQSKLKTLD